MIMIKNEPSGETGANPVRARRRKAKTLPASPDAAIGERAIGIDLRRLAGNTPSRNIRAEESLSEKLRAPVGENKFKENNHMKMKGTKRFLSFILCVMLTAAMAFTAIGCNGRQNGENAVSEGEAKTYSDGDILGEGDTEFLFTVVDMEGAETHFTIRTDKKMVGEALEELGLIAGEESEYGLFVKTVNGITADFDKDGVYWAFYAGGEYAQTGVDATQITQGESYSFKVE